VQADASIAEADERALQPKVLPLELVRPEGDAACHGEERILLDVVGK